METQQTPGSDPGVSEQHRAGGADAAIKATPQERQAVEVRPMRYVLGFGIVLSALGIAVVYFLA